MASKKMHINKPTMPAQAPMSIAKQLIPASPLDAPRFLPGFPNGWFSVGISHELPPGGLLSRQFMGHELVIFRTRTGTACAIDAYCPHMGAHLGHGGTVEDEVIRCPFHGFCFDRSGECVATGYGTKPPPTARLGTWPLHEVNDVLLVYYDAEGKEPTWRIPAFDSDGWTRPLFSMWRLRTHPQETTENSVDIGHLYYIHGYQSVDMLSDLLTNGPYLNVRYAMQRPVGIFGKTGQGVRAEFEIHVHGLGYSLVEVSVPSYGLHTRHIVCATPITNGWIELRVTMSMQKISQPQQINPLLWLIPRTLINKIISRLAFKTFVHDLQQDFEIWEYKRYTDPPVLAVGDGPVGKYRTWVRQFYPRASNVATNVVQHV